MSSPEHLIGRQIGRYTITSHLASGGMAELFIARQEAVGGFEKDLVLKMLQAHYAENPRVVRMFLDEARLAAKLNHQNIVHVYDVSEADGIRYIAMEYIHGETVTDIVRRSIARGGFLPIEHAVQIVADTAAGLAYAHDRRDAEGRTVRIIHRDVSPSNILVTYEGQTKIVDFGIARIQDQIREESGMRPGKVSYMSPEQVRGEAVDHRSDVFSLGIILYEITVGRRLWRGPPEAVMRRIVEEQIPPPTYVRREYPPALEMIVMKALEKRPGDRHQSAQELEHELREFLEEAGMKSGSQRLARYMKELFAPGPDQPIEDLGRAPTLSEPAGQPMTDLGRDDSEELDFDRRAPLVMRVEARPEALVGPGSGPAVGARAPVPPMLDDVDEPARAPVPVVRAGARAAAAAAVTGPALPAAPSPSPSPSSSPPPVGGGAPPGRSPASVRPPVPPSVSTTAVPRPARPGPAAAAAALAATGVSRRANGHAPPAFAPGAASTSAAPVEARLGRAAGLPVRTEKFGAGLEPEPAMLPDDALIEESSGPKPAPPSSAPAPASPASADRAVAPAVSMTPTAEAEVAPRAPAPGSVPGSAPASPGASIGLKVAIAVVVAGVLVMVFLAAR
jgi:serine/threonine protein kinase